MQGSHALVWSCRSGEADRGGTGKNCVLQRTWISSSSRVSPHEPARFLSGLPNRALPLTPGAMAQSEAFLESVRAGGGWKIQGKPGGDVRAVRMADSTGRGGGWFVGWGRAQRPCRLCSSDPGRGARSPSRRGSGRATRCSTRGRSSRSASCVNPSRVFGAATQGRLATAKMPFRLHCRRACVAGERGLSVPGKRW